MAATGLILVVALIWVGFVEQPGTQSPAQTIFAASGGEWGASVTGVANQALTGTAPAHPGAAFASQGRDNVSVLAFSGAVMVVMTMVLLAYGRDRGTGPDDAVAQYATAGRRPLRRPLP